MTTRMPVIFVSHGSPMLALDDEAGRVLGCPVDNLANEMASHDEPIRKRIDLIFRKTHDEVRHVLTEAERAGELPGVDLDATAQAMLAYFEGVMMMAKIQNDPEVLRQLLPAMAQIRIPTRG